MIPFSFKIKLRTLLQDLFIDWRELSVKKIDNPRIFDEVLTWSVRKFGVRGPFPPDVVQAFLQGKSYQRVQKKSQTFLATLFACSVFQGTFRNKVAAVKVLRPRTLAESLVP